MKKAVIAMDSFKGTASGVAASVAACRGLLEVFPNARVICVPIADGGEGTVDAFYTAMNYAMGDEATGEYVHCEVTGPEFTPVNAKYVILPDKKTAVIEMAQASGLMLSKNHRPGEATTYGTGELIGNAVKRGCRKIIVGIGGSATNDCGIGALSALGIRFLDKSGEEVKPCGDNLPLVETIDGNGVIPALKDCELILACDVTNTLCGPDGASFIYGPQKGATYEDARRLDKNLYGFATKIEGVTGNTVISRISGGAAGGLAAGLMAFFKVCVCSGITLLLETVKFNEMIKDADIIITGEGRFDSQSANGKAVSGICEFAQRADVPVFVLAGELSDDYERTAEEIGVSAAFSITHSPRPLSETIEQTEFYIYDTVKNICRVIKTVELG